MNENTLTKGRRKKIIILEYKSWLIILEPNFPSNNFVLTKKHASHGFRPAYCSSLESSLKLLFNELEIENIKDNGNYSNSLENLSEVVLKTKHEISRLVSLDVKNLHVEERTFVDEG